MNTLRLRASLLALLATLTAPVAILAARAAKSAPPARAAHPPETALVRSAQALPAGATFAVFLEGEDASTQVRAFLRTAGGARNRESQGQGEELLRAVGVDLLSIEGQENAGLAPAGLRMLVGDEDAVALVAPVHDEKMARKRLTSWLEQLGPARTVEVRKHKVLVAGAGRQVRAALVGDLGLGLRLHSASGKGAAALLTTLVQLAGGKDHANLVVEPLVGDAFATLHGPLSLWVRGREAVTGAALDLELQETGLVARGRLLVRDEHPLLAGPSPSTAACAGSPLFCVRASPGPALRALAAHYVRLLVEHAVPTERQREIGELIQAALAAAQGGALLRVESIDWKAALASDLTPSALPFVLVSRAPGALLPPEPVRLDSLCLRAFGDLVVLGVPCPESAPGGLSTEGPTELVARFEPRLFLPRQGFSALDALRSPAGAALLVLQSVAGPLFAQSGTATLVLQPLDASHDARALSLDVRWPLTPPRAP